MYRQYKTTSTSYWNYQDKDKEGLTIKKPVPVELIKKIMPNVKAFSFEFQRTAFKKKGVDHHKYLQEVLSTFPVEYVEIFGSKQLEILPNCLSNHQLHTFKLRKCPKVQDFSILGQLTTLTKVLISGDSYQLGAAFYKLPKLTNLTLSANSIEDLDYLFQLEHLNYLELSGLTVKQLPTNFEQLTSLKVLNLRELNELTTFPSFNTFKQLENLTCYILPCLTALPDDFTLLEKLKSVNFYNLGSVYETFHLPASLCSNQFIHTLDIRSCPIKSLPDVFSSVSRLTKLSLNDLPITILPNSMHHLGCLESLQIQRCEILEDFGKVIGALKNIRLLRLENLYALPALDFNFSDLPKLEKLFLHYLPKIKILPAFSAENTQLNYVQFSRMEQLRHLPISMYLCEALETVDLDDLPIEQIPLEYSQFKNLKNFKFYNGQQLTYIPSLLIGMAATSLSISNTLIQKDGLVSISTITSFMRKKVPVHLHPVLAYWLFENYDKEPLTETIRQGTLEALKIVNSDIQLLLERNLHYLNDNNQRFKDTKIQPNETVAIIGTPQNSRAELRQQLKALGFQYKTKVTPAVKYILIGKKPFIKEGFLDNPRLLFTESEFIKFQEKNHPKLLQQANTPKEYIENVRQLIWSNDPANELVALELVIHNGLPKELTMDFIVATKTGKNKKTRDKIRKFLKGNLPDGAKQVLNDRKVMTSSYYSYYDYQGKITDSEIAQLIFTYYKRFGKQECLPTFFRFDDGTSPYREEMFTALLPSFLVKSKFLKIQVNLTIMELNQILANPIFKGKLERLIINSKLIKTIPKEIFKHQTIKDLELHGVFEADAFPPQFFNLYKLNKLNLRWDNLKYIPPEISKLNRLKELFIRTEHSLALPDSFIQLTKLKRAVFYCRIKDSMTWIEAMPKVTFQ